MSVVDEFVTAKLDRLPDGFDLLLAESKAEGFRSLERLKCEYNSGINVFDLFGEALYSVSQGSELVAIGGVNRTSRTRGRVRRFYVSNACRNRGVGSRLLAHIESNAFKSFDELVLSTGSTTAGCFYEKNGYVRVEEPSVTHRKLSAPAVL